MCLIVSDFLFLVLGPKSYPRRQIVYYVTNDYFVYIPLIAANYVPAPWLPQVICLRFNPSLTFVGVVKSLATDGGHVITD